MSLWLFLASTALVILATWFRRPGLVVGLGALGLPIELLFIREAGCGAGSAPFFAGALLVVWLLIWVSCYVLALRRGVHPRLNTIAAVVLAVQLAFLVPVLADWRLLACT